MTNKFISKGLMTGIAFILSCTAPLAYAQTGRPEKMTIAVAGKPLENVLEKLSKQYDYQFFYNASLLKGISVSVSLQEADIHEIMKKLLAGTGLQYSLKERTIVITAIPPKSHHPDTAERACHRQRRQRAAGRRHLYTRQKPGNRHRHRRAFLLPQTAGIRDGTQLFFRRHEIP